MTTSSWCRFWISALIIAWFASAGAPSAMAQEVDLKVTAKQYVTDGLKAQSAGRYDEAIALYSKAYELIPHHELLFNLGQAHRLKGEKALALNYYQKYLVVDSKGRGAAEAAQWVRQLELELRVESEAKAEALRRVEEARQAAEQERAAAEQRRREAALAEQRAQPGTRDGSPPLPRKDSLEVATSRTSRDPEASSWMSRRTLAAGFIVGGGVSLAAGVLFYARGQDIYDDYKRGRRNGDLASKTEILYDDANRNHYIAQGLALGGVTMVGVAGYLWYTRSNSRKARAEDSSVRISPIIGGQLTGVTLTGGFR